MIILYHNDKEVVAVEGTQVDLPKNLGITETLFQLATHSPDSLLVWCHVNLKAFLNHQAIKELVPSARFMLSFSSSKKPYLPETLGYVDYSPFLKVNYNVRYPTFLMSPDVGAIYGKTLLRFDKLRDRDFGYTLNAISKIGRPQGLLCYSEPRFLTQGFKPVDNLNSKSKQVFKFVEQFYAYKWLLLLLMAYWRYKNRLEIINVFKACFARKKRKVKVKLDDLEMSQAASDAGNGIDVIIPTIGRSQYLFNVLKDLAKQTVLPKTVIIVEQNPDENARTELDYLAIETWPFKIIHQFTHKTGACHARNLALKNVSSDWVFMADDDIRIPETLLDDFLLKQSELGAKAYTIACLTKDIEENSRTVKQWESFGSGCSFIKSQVSKKIKFDESFEHGFGEDVDFGMQLRNLGVDIFYLPTIQALHLKAPVGGFRKLIKFKWDNDEVEPKPSPTVMLFHLRHRTKQQLQGYRWVLFLKYYKKQNIKNPIRYIRLMKKRWNASLKWANYLDNNSN